MFILNEKTGLYWFNSQCNFCDDEFGLIGLLFGLAIYNNILIDVRFPSLVYMKLLARPAVFDELAQIDSVSTPSIYLAYLIYLPFFALRVRTFCRNYTMVYDNCLNVMMTWKIFIIIRFKFHTKMFMATTMMRN